MADDVYIFAAGPIELNAGQRRTRLTVHNTGDRAVQIGSHFHFFEVNRAMSFDREKAFGMRLDIPAGTAVRFEAGDTKEVKLVEYGGGLRIVGFGGLLNGSVRSSAAKAEALARMRARGYLDEPEEQEKEKAATGRTAAASRTSASRTSASRTSAGKSAAGKTSAGKTSEGRHAASRSRSGGTTTGRKKPAKRPASSRAGTSRSKKG
ncbi:urease subunit beta [Actinomadura graeca]|uniref:Urease subunit beta n=1 Tax=Actinomadura graeca TaxID=2750812 RepID=A0ABX8QVB4_9ACTN|nr:urease subunit beta [Actinomadura graeca]